MSGRQPGAREPLEVKHVERLGRGSDEPIVLAGRVEHRCETREHRRGQHGSQDAPACGIAHGCPLRPGLRRFTRNFAMAMLASGSLASTLVSSVYEVL